MIQIPEELLQSFMKMTGMSRKEAEKAIAHSFQEMSSGPIFNAQMPQSDTRRKGKKPKYSESNYPHFLPAKNVRKYTLRISLKDIKPTIWRKIECPSNISLRHLTELIIKLMGWSNAHLNKIIAPHEVYYAPFYQNSDDDSFYETYYQEEYTIADLLKEKGKTVRWEYDFGDSWMHEIRLSSIAEYNDGEPHVIVCKGGKRACPPEDCGGIYGYIELLELHDKLMARKRLTADEKEHLEWYDMGRYYDPDEVCEEDWIYACEDFSDDDIMPLPEDEASDNADITPLDNSSAYDELMDLAFRMRKLELWEDLNDSDVFAIRMSDGSTMYIALMGHGGETFDIQMYDGAEEFNTYLDMIRLSESNAPGFEMIDSHNWCTYHSIMYLNDYEGIMPEEELKKTEAWAKAHSININKNHGYPFPNYLRPHHMPTIVADEATLLRMKEVMEAIHWFTIQIHQSEDFTEYGFTEERVYATEKGGKVVPLIVKENDTYKVERTKLPGTTRSFKKVVLPQHEISPLSSLKKAGTFLCKFIHIPTWVGDQNDPANVTCPLFILLVDKKKDMISTTEPQDLSDTPEEDALKQLIKKLQDNSAIPQRIIVDDARTKAVLEDFCKQLDIILETKRTRIPKLTDICQDLYDSFY